MNELEADSFKAVLKAAGGGDARASRELLVLVYGELRRLARVLLGKVAPGNTLQPTALVHEAYLRLVGQDEPTWNSRGHFFTAAAEGMRQILVEQARRKASQKRGGGRRKVALAPEEIAVTDPSVDILALDEALERLRRDDPLKAQLVLLRYFAGLSREEAAAALDLSLRTADREWRYVIARLHCELSGAPGPATPETDEHAAHDPR